MFSPLALVSITAICQRAMVWDVGSEELRQMADSDPSLEHFTRAAYDGLAKFY